MVRTDAARWRHAGGGAPPECAAPVPGSRPGTPLACRDVTAAGAYAGPCSDAVAAATQVVRLAACALVPGSSGGGATSAPAAEAGAVGRRSDRPPSRGRE